MSQYGLRMVLAVHLRLPTAGDPSMLDQSGDEKNA